MDEVVRQLAGEDPVPGRNDPEWFLESINQIFWLPKLVDLLLNNRGLANDVYEYLMSLGQLNASPQFFENLVSKHLMSHQMLKDLIYRHNLAIYPSSAVPRRILLPCPIPLEKYARYQPQHWNSPRYFPLMEAIRLDGWCGWYLIDRRVPDNWHTLVDVDLSNLYLAIRETGVLKDWRLWRRRVKDILKYLSESEVAEIKHEYFAPARQRMTPGDLERIGRHKKTGRVFVSEPKARTMKQMKFCV
jgi:hypothetical protein